MTQPSWFIAFDAPLLLQQRTPPPKVRLLHPRDHHLTVAFFGTAGLEHSTDAWDLLVQHLPSPFCARTGACSWFGGHTPRAISCEVTGPELVQWIGQVRPLLLRAAKCEPDERTVRPHVTLARIKHRASTKSRNAAEAWMDGLVAEAELELTDLALYTWATPDEPGQPRYRRVRTAKLR